MQKKVFGIDLGVASIGWAIVSHPTNSDESYELIDCGVRIVPLDSKETDEFQKGGNVPTNVARRTARGARRNLQRFRLRRAALYRTLTRLKMMPGENLLKSLTPLELFSLREKALQNALSLEEIGRALIHLNLRRGYKSSRKDRAQAEKEMKADSYLGQIEAREAQLSINHQTIGQRFAVGLQESSNYRVRQQIFNRSTYIEEFDQIWKFQAKFHPNTLTEANYKLLRDKIIYRQRPLKSAKNLVGECALEWNYALEKTTHEKKILPNGLPEIVRPKCAPKSSPLAQECKVWESIHNLRIYDEKGTEFVLTPTHKQQIFEVLQLEEKNLTATRLLKDILKLSPKAYSVDKLIKEKGLESNRTRAKLLAVFQKVGIQRRDLLDFNPAVETVVWTDTTTGQKFQRLQLKGDFDKEPLYQLWHLIYATEEDKDLIRILQERYGFTQEQAKAVAEIDFTKEGYTSKSHRAMRRLLPHYRNNHDYTRACELAGYNHSNSLTKLENENRTLLPKLEIIPKNTLRNPVVEKVLNQMIHLVNDLMAQYGRPDEIRVELARELKQSAKERQSAEKRNRDREREHKQIRNLIAEDLHIQPESVTKVMIEKWKLWTEVDGFSIYTGEKIDRAALLLGETVDIEHIIPKIRRFDDSFENKTICERKLNQDKNKDTAYDFMKSQSVKGIQSFDSYLKMIKDLADKEKGGISKAKYTRLMMSAEALNDDTEFIARQLRDTQYIAKKAKSLLQDVCTNVYSTSGSITDFLRHQWGWDEVIEDLRIAQFREMGLTKWIKIRKGTQDKEIIEGWDKRKDHRHHAIDALVTACTRQSHIQKLNTLNQTLDGKLGNERRTELNDLGRDKFLAGPAPFSFKKVAAAIDSIFISFKQGTKVATRSRNKVKGQKAGAPQVSLTPRGALHKETVYGQIKRYSAKPTPLNSRFKPEWVEKIAHPYQKDLVAARLAAFEGDPKKAFKDLEKQPILYGKDGSKKLNAVTLWEDWYVAREQISPGTTANKVGYIVDGAVKAAVSNRFAATNDPRKAFDKLAENPILVNQNSVKSARILNPAEAMIRLPRGYAKSDGNHHIAIYLDADGKKQEHVVRFWDAFQRLSLGLPAIIKDVSAAYEHVEKLGDKAPDDLYLPPSPDWKFVVSLMINDMFVFDSSPEELQSSDPNSRKIIGKKLFRVRKLTSGAYWFLHHLETQILEDNHSKEGGRCKQCSMSSLAGAMKVKVDRLGKIINHEPPVI